MPVIKIEMFVGRTIEQKRAMTKAITESFIATAGGTAQSVHIIVTEVARENWAVGGLLCSDLAAVAAQSTSN